MKIDLRAWDPGTVAATGLPGAGAGMATVTVAKYAYDSSGVLTATWDPRVADGAGALKTEYEYLTGGGHARLTKVTEPGLVPWRIGYDTGGRVSTIKRAHPAEVGTGDATWTVKYDIGLDATGDGLPDLSAAQTARWGQPAEDAPTATTTPTPTPSTPSTSSTWTGDGRHGRKSRISCVDMA